MSNDFNLKDNIAKYKEVERENKILLTKMQRILKGSKS